VKDRNTLENRKDLNFLDKKDEREGVISPFTTTTATEEKKADKIEKVQDSRSKTAKKTDKSFNAPIAGSVEKWAKSPSQTDLPGVDTIPDSKLKERADRFADKATKIKDEKTGKPILDKVEEKGQAKNLQGKFSPYTSSTYGEGNIVRVQKSAKNKGTTLAHELGHAVSFFEKEKKAIDARREKDEAMKRDVGVVKMSDDLIGNDRNGLFGGTVTGAEDLKKEDGPKKDAKEISERMRGSVKKQRSYRGKPEEKFADFVSSVITEPRAAKREAPELYSEFKQKAQKDDTLKELFGF
jgi:hypothetical protein